jgi:uncharacterized protein
VDLVYYRSGQDIFFSGTFHGFLKGRCSRCTEEYSFTLDKPFEFVLTPDPTKADRRAEELHRDDLGVSYYSSDEIDLEPLIAEQVILALPTRPLCSDDCRGLCSHCGANRNKEDCSCSAEAGDPRMAIFRSLKVGR